MGAARSSIDASQLKITKAVQAEKEKSTLIQRELDDEKAANFELRQAVSECKAEICKMEAQLQTSVNNVENRCNEISQLQSTCKTLQNEIEKLSAVNRASEENKQTFDKQIMSMSDLLDTTRADCRQSVLELAHVEERLRLSEQNAKTLQQELTCRIQALARF